MLAGKKETDKAKTTITAKGAKTPLVRIVSMMETAKGMMAIMVGMIANTTHKMKNTILAPIAIAGERNTKSV